MIKKVVIPAAGRGTRLLPITKELPKEMLPLFFKEEKVKVRLKPMLQAVFEQLYGAGFREFSFIVGRGKRVIEDHFTPDRSFIKYLKSVDKTELANEMQNFYEKICDSTIVFINQPEPKGFGNAVFMAKPFTKNEPFLMHAGDDIVLSLNNHHLKRMMEIFEKQDADAVFLVEKVEDPRRYGVMVGKEIESHTFQVEKVIEKPKKPPSNLAVVAIYIFKPIIYEAIEKVRPDASGEIQLADALQALLDWRCKLYALELGSNEKRIDIGTPETYLETLKEVWE